MNYKEFENKLREERDAAVPEMPKYYEQEKPKQMDFMKIAMGAAALVLCCAIAFTAVHFGPSIFVGDNAQNIPPKDIPQAVMPTDILSDGVVSGENTPDWYGNKPLVIKTLSSKNLNLEDGEQFVAAPNLKYFEVRKLDENLSYDPSYKYVDAESGAVVEVADLVKPILVDKGLIKQDGYFRIHDYIQSGTALVSFGDGNFDGGSVEYLVNTINKECKKIELSDRNANSDIIAGNFSPDGAKLFLQINYSNSSEESYRTPYYYDMNTGTAINLRNKLQTLDGGNTLEMPMYWKRWGNDIEKAGYDKGFSPTGKYLMLAFFESDKIMANTQERKMLYNTESGQATLFEGKVDHYTANDEYAIISSENGGYKIKCETGELIKMTAENTEISDYIRIFEVRGDLNFGARLFYHNLINGQTRELADSFEYGYTMSNDHKYLYYYILGSDNVVCVEISTWKSFAVPVDADFKASVKAINNEKWTVDFTLMYDESKNELVIAYMPATPIYMIGDESHLEWYETSVTNPIFMLTEDGVANSSMGRLRDALFAEDYILLFTKYLSFSAGDGFLACKVEYNDKCLVIVEDTRDNTLTYYDKIDGEYKVRRISESYGDIETLKQTLLSRGLEVKTAETDYNKVIERDLNNSMISERYYHDKTAFMENVYATYVVDTKRHEQGQVETFNQYEITDTAKIEKIYDFVMSKNPEFTAPVQRMQYDKFADGVDIGFVKKNEMSVPYSGDFPDLNRYMPSLTAYLLDGKYMISFGYLEAEITAADFEIFKGYYNDILNNGSVLTDSDRY